MGCKRLMSIVQIISGLIDFISSVQLETIAHDTVYIVIFNQAIYIETYIETSN